MRTLLLPAALALGLSAAGAAVVTVNAAPPAPDAAGPHGERARPLSRPSERVEPRIAYIKTALKITDSQNTVFNNFADAMRKQAKLADAEWDKHQAERAQREAGNAPPPKSAIERMQDMQDRMTKGAQRIGDMLAAAKPLYAALSDEQKRVADELLAPHHWGHGHMGEHMGHMGGHEGGPAGAPPPPKP